MRLISTGPLFMTISGAAIKPPPSQNKLEQTIRFSKFPAQFFSSHSFQNWWSHTYMAFKGCSVDEIQKKGHWLPRSFLVYIRPPKSLNELTSMALQIEEA